MYCFHPNLSASICNIFVEVKTVEEQEEEEEKLMTKYYVEYKEKLYCKSANDAGANSIPRFYFKVSLNNTFIAT